MSLEDSTQNFNQSFPISQNSITESNVLLETKPATQQASKAVNLNKSRLGTTVKKKIQLTFENIVIESVPKKKKKCFGRAG